MNKKLEKIKKEVKTAEDSRKSFIAKFQNGLKEINTEIEQHEDSLQQSITSENFEAFESESERLAFLRDKKKQLEIGLYNAETASIGDYDSIRRDVFNAMEDAAKAKVKEVFQHTAALKSIAEEVEGLRNEAEGLLWSIQSWTDHPQNSLGLDKSADLIRWAYSASQDSMYEETLKEHPEWSRLK